MFAKENIQRSRRWIHEAHVKRNYPHHFATKDGGKITVLSNYYDLPLGTTGLVVHDWNPERGVVGNYFDQAFPALNVDLEAAVYAVTKEDGWIEGRLYDEDDAPWLGQNQMDAYLERLGRFLGDAGEVKV